MNIRLATPEDAGCISSLIAESAHHFMLDPAGLGADRFLQGITPEAVRGYITDPAFLYLVIAKGTEIIGAAALRDGKHLYHLFVSPNYQRQGLARALWSSIKARSAAAAVACTVNASPNALAVYERFGFVVTGARMEMNGIAFVPMALSATAVSGRDDG